MGEMSLRDQPITITTLERLIESPTIPARYETVGDMLAAVLLGREVGVGEMTSIQELYLIDGQAAMSSKLMLALIFRRKHRVFFKLHEDSAEVTAWRWDPDAEDHVEFGTFQFTWEDAEQAGLTGKDNWKKYPKTMMGWRALALAARFVFPDVFLGLGYIPDEIGFDVAPDALPQGDFIEIAMAEDEELLTAEEVAHELSGELMT